MRWLSDIHQRQIKGDLRHADLVDQGKPLWHWLLIGHMWPLNSHISQLNLCNCLPLDRLSLIRSSAKLDWLLTTEQCVWQPPLQCTMLTCTRATFTLQPVAFEHLKIDCSNYVPGNCLLMVEDPAILAKCQQICASPFWLQKFCGKVRESWQKENHKSCT